MAKIDRLLAECEALEADSTNPLAILAHSRHLREGIKQLFRENEQLRAQRSSLETQVMHLAQEADWYAKITFIIPENDNTLLPLFDETKYSPIA